MASRTGTAYIVNSRLRNPIASAAPNHNGRARRNHRAAMYTNGSITPRAWINWFATDGGAATKNSAGTIATG